MRFVEVTKKDLKSELKTKSSISIMLLFSLTSAFLFSAAISEPGKIFSSLILLISLLAGMLGYSATFLREYDSETIEGLKASPLTPQEIIMGKTIFNLLLMFFVQIFIFPICYALFDVSGNFILAFSVFTICNTAFSISITAISPIMAHSKAREMLLPVVLFPIIFPLISSTVIALNTALEGLVDVNRILFVVAYSGIIVSLSMITAEKVV